MKKALKVILPLFIILVLLIMLYWFFFYHRTDITAGALAKMAEKQMNAEQYSKAVRYYSLANKLVPEDTEIAIRLAEAYRKIGNYTKTEYTLVNAIRENPSDPSLYVMLSQVYVEQNKLLDAQVLLDGIQNDAVRAALDAKRPAAPELTPPGGIYNDYIDVKILPVEGATLYITIDGSFPGTENDHYQGAITLPGGDTTVKALAVSPDGLVSQVTSIPYTITNVSETVEFHDDGLKTAMSEYLHKDPASIRTDDLWAITELKLVSSSADPADPGSSGEPDYNTGLKIPGGLTDAQDLSHCTGMTKLTLWDMGVLDYSFLASMPNLRYLELNGCTLTTENMGFIGQCSNLETLILVDCGLSMSNLTPLKSLTGLRLLDLTDNSISNIDSLLGNTELEELYLGHNAMESLPSLRGFTKLKIVDLSYNALTNVTAISGCPTIERLNLANNRLTSVSAVGALVDLVYFNASNNKIDEVSALEGCTKLETFLMESNVLVTIDFLANVHTIREVDIDYNDVLAVPDFPEDCMLETFSGAHNFLEDLSGLAGLQYLVYVNADHNNIRDIDVLIDCPRLAKVDVFGTYITDGGELAKKGVVVNFKPNFN